MAVAGLSSLKKQWEIAALEASRVKSDRVAEPIDLTLRQFVIDAWENVLHPSEPLQIDGAWYLDLICEYLTLVSVSTLAGLGEKEAAIALLKPYGKRLEDLEPWQIELKKLLINISPRCSKSTIVTVCWPCWEWLSMPWLTYFCLSYDQSLATDHNDDRRKLIQSDWYQNLCGGLGLSNSKNRQTEFRNEHQGEQKARGLNGGVTGGGGLRLIFDDPNDPNKVESDPIRKNSLKSFRDYSTTRRNDPKRSAVVVVQQRTHQRDISGWILSDEPDWQSVIIPMEAEVAEEIHFPLSDRIVTRQPGEIMHPERFPPEVIASLKRDEKIWAGRYQQRPSASGGGMFKLRNWRLYIPGKQPRPTRSILSVDAAFKGTEQSDFVVVGVVEQQYGIRELPGLPRFDPRSGREIPTTIIESRYYLPYRFRDQVGITGTEQAIQKSAITFPQCHIKLIEDKANGPAIIERLSRVLKGITPYKPGSDSKQARAAAVQPIQQRGDICLPLADWAIPAVEAMGVDSLTLGEWWDMYPPNHESDAEHAPVPSWCKSLMDEAALFPSGADDDQVDMFVQALNWLESQPLPRNERMQQSMAFYG